MSGNSNPSSMNAQNGSAYSNPSHRDDNTTAYRYEDSSAAGWDRARRNGGAYQIVPPAPTTGQPATHHQGYAGQAYYFPPDETYAQQPARYDNNLAVDDDQNGTSGNSGYTSQTMRYNNSYYPQQTSAQAHYSTYGNGHSNTQHSETTRRWSTEISPEERLRLGLPRYESEEQRLAYENAGVQYDEQQQQQYDNNTQQ